MKYARKFRVKPGSRVDLGAIDPGFTAEHEGRDGAREETEALGRRLRELQEMLYAEHRRSLLVCLQAMDAGGKDGTVSHVLGWMNPQGCKVVSFKQPTAEEREHDFLWRVHAHAPRVGEVSVFNRSHYEDVLVARVHGLAPEKVWAKRYDQINDFEAVLRANGTHVLKFFLHISKGEQLRRFKDRLDDPSKQWKISDADYSERLKWDDYARAYEDALSRCSTKRAPWFVIPADHKWFRNLAVSRVVVEYLEKMEMSYPAPSVDLAEIRKAYLDAGGV